MMTNHRKALEFLWKGRCTVKTMEEVFNEVTKRTEFVEVVRFENCSLQAIL